jgi:hypothetical protein
LTSHRKSLFEKLRKSLLALVHFRAENPSPTQLKRKGPNRDPFEDEIVDELHRNILDMSHVCLDDKILDDPLIKQFPWNEPLVIPLKVREKLQWLMEDDSATFKSVEQARMFAAIAKSAQQQQHETVTTVMATRAGKTLPILLSALLPGAMSTVVITPFVGLMEDFEAHCCEKEVTCERWSRKMSTRPKIIAVAAETITNSKYFLADLVNWTRPDN